MKKLNLVVGPNTSCFYACNLTNRGIKIGIENKFITVSPNSEIEIICKNDKDNSVIIDASYKYIKYYTGNILTLFVHETRDFPADHKLHHEKMYDFLWLSGFTEQKLLEIGEQSIDEDVDGVYCHRQVWTPYLLPCLRRQIDLLQDNWRTTRVLLDSERADGSIPRIFHFVWLVAEPGRSINPLRNSHIARAKTWLLLNGDAFEYWIWTDAKSEDDLNVSELRILAADLGISERLRIIPIEKLWIDANRHFQASRYIKSGENNNDTQEISYRVILDIIIEYSSSRNVGIRSDVMKFLILYLNGGVYLDINDTECIKPFKKLIAPFDFVACMEPQGYINTAMAAARRHSEVLFSYLLMLWRQRSQISALNAQIELYLERLENIELSQRDQYRIRNAIDRLVVRRTGPIAFTKSILGYLSEPEHSEVVAILPSAFFYPGWGLMRNHAREDWIKPVSYANHYDERAYVGHVNDMVDQDVRLALGELPGSSSVQSDGYL